MRRYYTEDGKKRYGVLGIKVALCGLEVTLKEQEQYDAMIYERYFPDGMK